MSFIVDHLGENPIDVPDFSSDGLVPPKLSERGLGRLMAYVAALCGHVPRLRRAADVARLAGQLLRTDQLASCEAVLQHHADLQANDAELCLMHADLHKRREEWGNELVCLLAAWAADTSRWQTLVQILWSTRRLGKGEVQAWAARLLQSEFPERWAEVARDRDWLQQAV